MPGQGFLAGVWAGRASRSALFPPCLKITPQGSVRRLLPRQELTHMLCDAADGGRWAPEGMHSNLARARALLFLPQCMMTQPPMSQEAARIQ